MKIQRMYLQCRIRSGITFDQQNMRVIGKSRSHLFEGKVYRREDRGLRSTAVHRHLRELTQPDKLNLCADFLASLFQNQEDDLHGC